jgi:hypothetical protein
MKRSICDLCFNEGLLRVAFYFYIPDSKRYFVCKKHKQEVKNAGFQALEIKDLFEPY